MRHPFRVARRIGHRRRTALRAPHEGEPIEAERVDDRFEIANERIDGELRTVPIRKTVAALVVVDEAMVPGELFGPVAPHRAVPAERQVAQPMRGPHERRAIADLGIGDPHVIRGPAKLHLVQGRAGMPLRSGQQRDRIDRADARVGLKRHLRRLPQRAGAHHVEFLETALRALKLLLRLAHAAAGAQQSNQRGVDGFIGRLEQAKRARVRQGLIGHALETADQCRKQPHAQPPRRLALPGAPALKLQAVGSSRPSRKSPSSASAALRSASVARASRPLRATLRRDNRSTSTWLRSMLTLSRSAMMRRQLVRRRAAAGDSSSTATRRADRPGRARTWRRAGRGCAHGQ